jgi:predicted ribosome quality control (RQC) complex YloA/Tae2 family protein
VKESDALRTALVRRRRRVRKRLGALTREFEDTGDPEESRSIGNLLLARLSELPARGTARVELTDFDGSLRAVELDPALDIAANARAYFEEAARRERARAKLPTKIAAAERELARVGEALERLEAEGLSDSLWELAGGRPVPGSRRDPASADEPLPFLQLRSSGGLEIRVGRSARANDRLTFAYSAPDDIWLHARQVQGAHVILRWGRRDENPPKKDLLEAALVAAVYSGARHSGSVAVDWTRRKHVRRPRKAAPGTVVPDRVKTLFVEPDEDLVKRLKSRAGE